MSNFNPEFKPGDRVVVLAEPRYQSRAWAAEPYSEVIGLTGEVLDCEVYPATGLVPDYRIKFDEDSLSRHASCAAVDEPYLALRKTNEHHHQGLTACRIKAEPGLAEAG